MNKKGQGLSINTIIIAIIALTVLVVLVMIFTGAMGEFVKKLGLIKEKYCVKAPTGMEGKVSVAGGEKYTNECPTGKEKVFGVFEDIKQELGEVCCK